MPFDWGRVWPDRQHMGPGNRVSYPSSNRDIIYWVHDRLYEEDYQGLMTYLRSHPSDRPIAIAAMRQYLEDPIENWPDLLGALGLYVKSLLPEMQGAGSNIRIKNYKMQVMKRRRVYAQTEAPASEAPSAAAAAAAGYYGPPQNVRGSDYNTTYSRPVRGRNKRHNNSRIQRLAQRIARTTIPPRILIKEDYVNLPFVSLFDSYLVGYSDQSNGQMYPCGNGRWEQIADVIIGADDSGASFSNSKQFIWHSSYSKYEFSNPNNFPIEFLYYSVTPIGGETHNIGAAAIAYAASTDVFPTIASVSTAPTLTTSSGRTSGLMPRVKVPSWFYMEQLPDSFQSQYIIRKKKKGVLAPGGRVNFVIKKRPGKVSAERFDDISKPQLEYPMWRFRAPVMNTSDVATAAEVAQAGRPGFNLVMWHLMKDVVSPLPDNLGERIYFQDQGDIDAVNTDIHDQAGTNFTVPTVIDLELADEE